MSSTADNAVTTLYALSMDGELASQKFEMVSSVSPEPTAAQHQEQGKQDERQQRDDSQPR